MRANFYSHPNVAYEGAEERGCEPRTEKGVFSYSQVSRSPKAVRRGLGRLPFCLRISRITRRLGKVTDADHCQQVDEPLHRKVVV